MRKIILLILLIICPAFLYACSSEKNETITVAAATSLTDVLQEIKVAFEEEYPNTEILFSFAGSGTIQQQIEQNAPIDVFFSAGDEQVSSLEDKKLVSNVVNILKNELVLIAPLENESISNFDDLKADNVKIIAIGEPDIVPLGSYSKDFLNTLNIYSSIEDKLNFGLDARQVLTWVELNEADAGIVYKTDALTSQKLKIIETADYDKIIYPACIVNTTKSDLSYEFVSFLQSETANKIFENYGFVYIGG